VTSRPRLFGPRRWWALGVVGVLLVGSGVAVAAGASAPDQAPAAEATTPAPAPISLAADGSSPASVAEEGIAWAAQFGIPADATEEESLRIKLSFDIVSVPLDQRAALESIPGVSVVAPITTDDTFSGAVPRTQSDLVRAQLPDADIRPNQIVTAEADQTPVPSWGLDVVDNTASARDDNYLYDSTGEGVTAYVIDTGVQASHPDFGGRVDAFGGADFIGDGRGTDDCNGHGTHVAGTIGSTTYGVAKKVTIIPLRVFGCKGEGSSYDVFRALEWISQHVKDGDRSSVVNMSLEIQGRDSGVDDQIAALSKRGVISVAAAGNDNKADACNYSPAGAGATIAVGAYDSSNSLASFSNVGSCVGILAPGVNIASTWIDSSTRTLNGTSMASPHVAGLVARLLQVHPGWGTSDVRTYFANPSAEGHISNVPSTTVNLVAAIPGIPRMASLTATSDANGIALAWTTNGIGQFTSFSITVTDETTGRTYPVTVSALRSSTVFTDVWQGHTYTASVTGTATMPSGEIVTTDPVTAAAP